MDYIKAKNSLAEMGRDIIKNPVRTGFVLALMIIAWIGYISIDAYVSKWAASEISKEIPQYLSQTTNTFPANGAGVSTETIYEDTGEHLIDIKYPIFGIAKFDAMIQETVNNTVYDFKRKDGRSQFPDQKKALGGSFESVNLDDNIASFKIEFCENLGSMRCISTILGFNYDRKNEELFTLNNALSLVGLDIDQLSSKVKKELKKIYGSEPDDKGIEPIRENFSTFVITNNSIIFVFQHYQVYSKMNDEPEVTIPRVK